MKKLFIFLFLSLHVCYSYSQFIRNKAYWEMQAIKNEVKIEMLKPIYSSERLFYENDSLSFLFMPDNASDCTFMKVSIRNKTDKRIYIEWENARICGSRAVSGKDRIIMMELEKADEAVSAGEFSETRSITPRSGVHSGVSSPVVVPMYEHSHSSSSEIPIILPVRFEGGIVDYKFVIRLSHFNDSEIDSLCNLRKENHELSKNVKKGMSHEQVREIMGSPSFESESDMAYPFVNVRFKEGVVRKIDRKLERK